MLSSYNGEKYIGQQIESIVNQINIDCVDILIRDDGSIDRTKTIIKDYIKNGYSIRLIDGQNVGFVASFLELIDYSFGLKEKYDYYLLSDQDDVWKDNKISAGIASFENDSNVLLYCSSSLPVNENLEPIKYKEKKIRINPYNSIIQNISAGHTYIFKETLLNIIKHSDPRKIYAHDSYIFTISCLLGKVYYDETPRVLYRQYSNNQLGTSNKGFCKYLKERFKRLKRGDFKKYGVQIKYIYDKYGSLLSDELYTEIESFITSQKSFLKRLRYAFKAKVFRQGVFDNFLFKIAYVFGKYNI